MMKRVDIIAHMSYNMYNILVLKGKRVMSINKPFINLISSITKKQMIIGAVTTAVVAGGAVTGAVIYNSTKPEPMVSAGVSDNDTTSYRVVLSSGHSVSAESVYAQLKADYGNVAKLTASLADSDGGEGIVLLAEAESVDDMVVVFGDGSKIKNFVGATEFDEVIVCKSGNNKVDFDVKIVIEEEESTEPESTGVSTTTSSSTATTTTSTTATTTSTTTTTEVKDSEERDEDNGDSPVDNNEGEPQGNVDNGGNTSGNGGSGQTQTTVKPSDNTPKPVETSAPKPVETEKPKPTETSAPKPTDPPAPVSQCGEGCQYFNHLCCHEGNEGYPDWYGSVEKSNYVYAYNQAVSYGSSYPDGWATVYVAAVSAWGADRVMIGDPTDGEGYNNVWILTNPDEDEWTRAVG